MSNYYVSSSFCRADAHRLHTSGAHITFPAGCTLSPDGKYLYVACNGEDSVAVIDTSSKTVVKQVRSVIFPTASR